MSKKMRISFTLDESDTAYFESIYRAAKKNASPDDWAKISRGVRKLIKEVRETKKVPAFVTNAITSLEDLIEMVDDMDYNAPKNVVGRAVAALAYFANPKDVIPDDVPLVGFLDDAIMIKFVEDDLKHEIWAYRKFRVYREGREQRFWTPTAKERLKPWLDAKRTELRKAVQEREAKDKARKAKK
ncbi:MAG: hypothetical protein CL910_09070 [Deltaproteobacteria bacterium]|jgi:uncharacterized membrane protein YkvA (DUF1232 family)|nr:hypothetical protein [Deltaproteobacteria bacterium]